MATSIACVKKLCSALSNLTLKNAVAQVTRQDLNLAPRTLINYQQTRGTRRRSTFHYSIWRPWWRRRKVMRNAYEDMSVENKEFLQEVVADKYAHLKDSPLKDAPWQREQWTYRPITIRTGVLALKIGVIPQWTKEGRKFHTTMLQILDNHVVDYIPPEEFVLSERCKDRWKGRDMKGKYGLSIVGAVSSDPHQFTPQYNELFRKAGVPPKRKLAKFLVTRNAKVQPGTPLNVTHYRVGDYIDVFGKTISHGFQGVMKRWGMKGGSASHGNTKSHRRPGAIGGGKKHGVWKGKKMPGRMGGDMSRLRGLRIWRINTRHNILYVHGPNIPGPCHSYVKVVDTVLKYRKERLRDDPPPCPTAYPEDFTEPLPEEIFHEDLFQFTSDTIQFADTAK